MTQDDIVEMAREAGFPTDCNDKRLLHSVELEAFAKLVAAAEREACAKYVEQSSEMDGWYAYQIAAEIRRERGKS